MDTRWKHPWNSMLSGPTGCGKTVYVQKFLKYIDSVSNTRFDRIILYYSEWQSGYRDLGKDTEFREGLPQSNDWMNNPKPKLIIIDDLMRESSSGGVIVNLFTKGSHHINLSVIFITQNVFHQGKGQHDIFERAVHCHIQKSTRSSTDTPLARQVYPENPCFLEEV